MGEDGTLEATIEYFLVSFTEILVRKERPETEAEEPHRHETTDDHTAQK